MLNSRANVCRLQIYDEELFLFPFIVSKCSIEEAKTLRGIPNIIERLFAKITRPLHCRMKVTFEEMSIKQT